MKISSFVIVLLFIIFYSCNNNTEKVEGEKEIKKIDTIIDPTTKSKDSVIRKVIVKYHSNGRKKDSFQTYNGKSHGENYVYYDNGNLRSKSTFYKGNVRDVIYYRKNGSLDAYKCYGYSGTSSYFWIEYDSTGTFKEKKGTTITTWSYSFLDDYGDSLQVNFIVAKPPFSKTHCKTSSFELSNGKIKLNEIHKMTPTKLNEIIYGSFVKKGEHRNFINVVKVHDTIHDKTFVDTLFLAFKGRDTAFHYVHSESFYKTRNRRDDW